MRDISITFLDARHNSARVTITPVWWRRWFLREREWVGHVELIPAIGGGKVWASNDTGRLVTDQFLADQLFIQRTFALARNVNRAPVALSTRKLP